jgi:hypothetical protein
LQTLVKLGFYAAQLARALRAERLRVEHVGTAGHPHRIQPHKIAINKPAIVLVSWHRVGGHFVEVGRCTHHAVSLLDPCDGHVNEQFNNGRYNAPYNNQGVIGEVLYVSA